jgi:hypothetical protein
MPPDLISRGLIKFACAGFACLTTVSVEVAKMFMNSERRDGTWRPPVHVRYEATYLTRRNSSERMDRYGADFAKEKIPFLCPMTSATPNLIS